MIQHQVLKNMEREIKTIKLSFCELTIKSYLTWGESEKITNVMLGAAKGVNSSGQIDNIDISVMTEQKFVILETAVIKIKQDEKEFDFNRDWLKGLRTEQGDEVIDAVNDTFDTGKKKP